MREEISELNIQSNLVQLVVSFDQFLIMKDKPKTPISSEGRP
jgi:hypothetical protein